MDGVDRREPSWGVPDHYSAVEAEVVGQGGARQVAAEEAAELVVGPEDQSADDGVEAVSSCHEVEPVGGGVLERHGDAVALLDDRGDRVLEQVLHVASSRLIEDGGQLAAHDLDVSARDTRDQTAHFDVDASTALALE